MPSLADTLAVAVPELSPGFRGGHARLWAGEHLARIADRLAAWHADGVPALPPPPHFAAECPPAFGEAFAPFPHPVALWDAEPDHPTLPDRFARALEEAGCANLLVLLGQRRTPATLTDARGIPPTTTELLASAAVPHRTGEELTAAARALAKHAHRSPDHFWGTPAGSSAVQNARAAEVLANILAGRTWWNVFGHFQHDTVFEARLPSGHGARWGANGAEFVGFLEPFDEAKCPSLTPGG